MLITLEDVLNKLEINLNTSHVNVNLFKGGWIADTHCTFKYISC